MGMAAVAPFQGTDGLTAQARLLGQRLLGEPDGDPVVA
jgi:hypothetical protein